MDPFDGHTDCIFCKFKGWYWTIGLKPNIKFSTRIQVVYRINVYGEWVLDSCIHPYKYFASTCVNVCVFPIINIYVITSSIVVEVTCAKVDQGQGRILPMCFLCDVI
ncbi:hypothetical protein ACF0H5_015423 [Mactra antiquata]